MSFIIGQCLLGRVPYDDGTRPKYDRPYLIVEVDSLKNQIGILNISSTAHKWDRLLYNTNVLINYSIPPLAKSGFVKIDSLVYISFTDAHKMSLMGGGKIIGKKDLQRVLCEYNKYIGNKD